MLSRWLSIVFSLMRRGAPSTANRRIFHSTLTGIVASSAAALVMIVRDVTMAGTFGVAASVDAYVLVYTILMYLTSVIGGSISFALLPIVVQLIEGGDEVAARGLVKRSALILGAVLLLLAVGLIAVSMLIAGDVDARFSNEQVGLIRVQLAWMAPILPLQGLVAVVTMMAHAHRKFAVPALAPAFSPLAAVVCLFLLPSEFGITAVAIGTMVGCAVQLALFVPQLKWLLFGAATRPPRSIWRGAASQYWPMMAGSLIWASAPVIDQLMAATLLPGSVAALSYGQKAVSLILAVGGVALANAVFPEFASQAARDDLVGMRRTLRTWRKIVMAIAIPLSIGTALISEPIVSLLFERGAFVASDTQRVAQIQAVLLFQLPFYLASILCTRLLSAFKRNDVLLTTTIGSLFVKVVLNFVLMGWFGVVGLAISTSIVYALAWVYVEARLAQTFSNKATRVPRLDR